MDGEWSRAERLSVYGIVVAAMGVAATLFVPEFRRSLGLQQPGLRVVLPPAPVLSTRVDQSVRSNMSPAGSPTPQTIRLTIEASETAWVTLKADGATVMSNELNPGQRFSFEAHDFEFRTIGNAGALKVNANGIMLGPFGGIHQVVHGIVIDQIAIQNAQHL